MKREYIIALSLGYWVLWSIVLIILCYKKESEQYHRPREPPPSDARARLLAIADRYFDDCYIVPERSVKISRDTINTRVTYFLKGIRTAVDAATLEGIMGLLVPWQAPRDAFMRAFPPGQWTTTIHSLASRDDAGENLDKQKGYVLYSSSVPWNRSRSPSSPSNNIRSVEGSGTTKEYTLSPFDPAVVRGVHPRALDLQAILPVQRRAWYVTKNGSADVAAVHFDVPSTKRSQVAVKPKPHPLSDNRDLLECLANMHPNHSVTSLANAMDSYPGWRLVLVGVGRDAAGVTTTLYFRKK
jgi:hypothetical protein